MKKLAILGVKYFLIILFSFQINAQNSENKIISIAEKQLLKTLSLIPEGQESSFGFINRNEFNQCTIGSPIQIITLAKNFDKVDLQNKIIMQNEWRIPVISDNHYKTLLTVYNNGSQYEVVDIGGSGLAKELELNSKNKNSSSKLCLLRIYQLSKDFMVVVPNGESFDKATYFPIISGDKNIFLKSSYNYNEVIELITKLINK